MPVFAECKPSSTGLEQNLLPKLSEKTFLYSDDVTGLHWLEQANLNRLMVGVLFMDYHDGF